MLKHARNCDEVWHAGDWGSVDISDELTKIVTVRGVYGNIDGTIIRKMYPKELLFTIEGFKVYITHIGGYPGRYQKDVYPKIIASKPDIFITGHSHICKVVKDKKLNLIHFNPGAIGNKGFHHKRTMITFELNKGKIDEVKVLEYDKNYET